MVESNISNKVQLKEIGKILEEHNAELKIEIEKLKSDHKLQISQILGVTITL